MAGLDEIALMPANLVAEEPEKKRARFAPDAETGSRESSMDDESASGDGEDGEEGGSEDEDSEDKAPPHTRWAEEVTTIRMLRGGAGAGVECEAGRFAPLYTHQVFYTAQVKDEEASDRERQELIIGYDEPKLEISYAANSLKAHVEFSCKGQVDVKLLKQESLSRTPVLNSLHKRVPMDYATKLSAVQTEAEAPFSPLGTLREEEKLPDGDLLQVFHFTADSPEAVKLVQRMQTFAVWLIETGQAIEVPDPRWNILTLYRVDKGADEQPVHTMLGFYTAYRYWVYDKVGSLTLTLPYFPEWRARDCGERGNDGPSARAGAERAGQVPSTPEPVHHFPALPAPGARRAVAARLLQDGPRGRVGAGHECRGSVAGVSGSARPHWCRRPTPTPLACDNARCIATRHMHQTLAWHARVHQQTA